MGHGLHEIVALARAKVSLRPLRNRGAAERRANGAGRNREPRDKGRIESEDSRELDRVPSRAREDERTG